jgi:VWFA-related protein
MKRIWVFGCILFLGFISFSQQIKEESLVINIEVPVRVYKDHTFVDTLALDDFEVLEDGVPQRIEAVYLIKKRTVERSEEKKRFAPVTERNFYLFFEITEYDSRLEQAVNFFIHNVVVPTDNLVIVTPMKTYRMKSKTFQFMPRNKVVEQLIGILRKDTLVGSSEYQAAIEEISASARALSAMLTPATEREGAPDSILDDSSGGELRGLELDEQVNLYATLLSKLETLRRIDKKKLMDFADYLKDKEGQKYVFMFYQKEYIPQIDPKILEQSLSFFQDRPDIVQNLSDLMSMYRRDVPFDVHAVKQAYADSSIAIHFLFLTKPPQQRYGVYYEEHSEDIFSAFQDMAFSTGGFTESSFNPDFLMRKAVEASENYYLLYYSPRDYNPDGKFRNIEVRVKKEDCQVSHRAGYFAN